MTFQIFFVQFTPLLGVSDVRVSERLAFGVIFLPIKFGVTAASALQNIRYYFPMRSSHGGSGVTGHAMVIVSQLGRSVHSRRSTCNKKKF